MAAFSTAMTSFDHHQYYHHIRDGLVMIQKYLAMSCWIIFLFAACLRFGAPKPARQSSLVWGMHVGRAHRLGWLRQSHSLDMVYGGRQMFMPFLLPEHVRMDVDERVFVRVYFLFERGIESTL
jgi:hypothetical protein